MDEGRWHLGTDAIGIDWSGRLVNGQHRLNAVLETCEPQRFLIALGLDPAVFAVLDAGRHRTAADALSISGFVQPTVVAALVRHVAYAQEGRLWSPNRKVEADEVLERARRMGDRLPEVVLAGATLCSRSKGLFVPSEAAFLFWVYGEDDRGPIQAFAEQVSTGFGIEQRGQPSATVRDALISNLRAERPLNRFERLALLVRGAEAHLDGRPLTTARAVGASRWPSPSAPMAWGWPQQVGPTPGEKRAQAHGVHAPGAGPFRLGDSVVVLTGPYEGAVGVVETVFPGAGGLRVAAELDGHTNVVDLAGSHVAHAD
ncbi:MAG TPA: KOW motif-containing protein [Rubricoccaceae bacterium]|jgi:hypothetical protein